jgi:hypothetical protein
VANKINPIKVDALKNYLDNHDGSDDVYFDYGGTMMPLSVGDLEVRQPRGKKKVTDEPKQEVIKDWVFVTGDGHTEDKDGSVVQNLQVLGFGKGDCAESAFEHMKKNHKYLMRYNFGECFCYEVNMESKQYLFLDDFCNTEGENK